MTPRKAKRPPPPPAAAQTSDYDTDYNVISEAVQRPPPTRSNDELNLAVIRRYRPDITAIISVALYAVVYVFAPESQAWEKGGIEGTLFICALTPTLPGTERYGVFILNRRGLENFVAELRSGEDVEITDEYVILQVDGDEDNGATTAPRIVGLWIYSDPPPSSTAEARRVNAEIIRECATRAERTRKEAETVAQGDYGYS